MCNTVRLLEAATNLIYIKHLKVCVFKLEFVLLLKYMHIFVGFGILQAIKPFIVQYLKYIVIYL